MGRAAKRKKTRRQAGPPAAAMIEIPGAPSGCPRYVMAPTRPPTGGNGNLRELAVRRLKVRIGYVAGGSTDEPFTFALARMWQYEGNKHPHDRVVAGMNRACGLYVDRNRETCSRGFLKTTDGGVLLLIDSDIEFHEAMPEHVSEIMSANPSIGVLAVNVPLGCNPTAGYTWDEDEGAYKPWLRLTPKPMMEVDGVATAICAIRREVLVDVAQHVRRARCEQRKALREGTAVDPDLHRWFSIFRPFDVFGDEDEKNDVDEAGIWCGEDLAFCWRVKQLGHRIFILRYPYPTFHWKRRPLKDEFENVLPAGGAPALNQEGPSDAAI